MIPSRRLAHVVLALLLAAGAAAAGLAPVAALIALPAGLSPLLRLPRGGGWAGTLLAALAASLVSARLGAAGIFGFSLDMHLWAGSAFALSWRLLFVPARPDAFVVPLLALTASAALELAAIEIPGLGTLGIAILAACLAHALSPPGARPLRLRLAGLAAGALVLALGVATAAWIHHGSVRFAERIATRIAGEASPGFSGSGALHAVTSLHGSSAEVLRISGPRIPAYLRGRAFDTWDGNAWLPAPHTGDRWHDDPEAGPAADATVRLAQRTRFLFVALGTARLWTDGTAFQVDRTGSVRADDGYAAEYSFAARRDRRPPSPEELALPEGWEVRLREAAGFPASPAALPSDAARAIAEVLGRLGAQQYALGYFPPPGAPAILSFLRDRSAAHCEYFATAAALLLRERGVPSRYVTGWIVDTASSSGAVVRMRQAHAWAEAWNGEEWAVVEATPSDGLPDRRKRFLDAILLAADRLAAMLEQIDAASLLDAATAPRIAIPVLILCAAFLLRRRFGRALASAGGEGAALLDEAGRLCGLRRPAHQTLGEYRAALAAHLAAPQDVRSAAGPPERASGCAAAAARRPADRGSPSRRQTLALRIIDRLLAELERSSYDTAAAPRPPAALRRHLARLRRVLRSGRGRRRDPAQARRRARQHV